MNTIVELETKDFRIVQCYKGIGPNHVWRSVHIPERDDLGHELPTFGSIEFLNPGDNYVKVMFRLDRVNYIVLTSGDAECANSNALMFAFGYFVAALMAAARRGEDMEWERKYNELVETVSRRTDQIKER